MSSRAATVAVSADDVAGMGVPYRKFLTNREIISERVLGM